MMKTEATEVAGIHSWNMQKPRPGRSGPLDHGLVVNATNALSWLIVVPGIRLLITAHDRWITLAGEVDRDYQRCAAVRATRQLRDVAGVSDLMTLKPRIAATPAVPPSQNA